MLVEKFDEKFLQFRTLTLVPLDPDLIDFRMLTYPEKKWLRQYHEMILSLIKYALNSEEKNWLQELLKKFS
jgi:Xaa-Pro aminopeptidase